MFADDQFVINALNNTFDLLYNPMKKVKLVLFCLFLHMKKLSQRVVQGMQLWTPPHHHPGLLLSIFAYLVQIDRRLLSP